MIHVRLAGSVGTIAMLAFLSLSSGRERAPLPVPRAGYAGGVVAGKLVVAGGSYWVGGEKHETARVDVFDPQRNTWSPAAPLPRPMCNAASVVYRGELYVFGGMAGNGAFREALRLHGDRWEPLPDARLPEPRSSPVAAATSDGIFLLGGFASPTDVSSAANTLSVWRPGAGWKDLASLPGPPRFTPAMAVANGKLYVFGGATAEAKSVRNLGDAYVYDPVKNAWAPLGHLPVARRAWWATTINSRILLFGGYTSDFDAEVYEFNPASGVMRVVGKLPHAVADAKFFAIGNHVFGAGGEAGPKIRGPWTVELTIHGAH
jgi:N-acetylneuraminic acid mutarotase